MTNITNATQLLVEYRSARLSLIYERSGAFAADIRDLDAHIMDIAERLGIEAPRDTRHTDFAQRVQKKLATHDDVPDDVEVDVSEWAGCDEPWDEPIYVTADDPEESREYHDAICDLNADTIDKQVDYVVEQLIHG